MSVCELVSVNKLGQIFMKFGTTVVYRKLWFRKRTFSDSHALPKGVNESLPFWVNFGTEDPHITPLSNRVSSKSAKQKAYFA
jgi:hypothetical protein